MPKLTGGVRVDTSVYRRTFTAPPGCNKIGWWTFLIPLPNIRLTYHGTYAACATQAREEAARLGFAGCTLELQ